MYSIWNTCCITVLQFSLLVKKNLCYCVIPSYRKRFGLTLEPLSGWKGRHVNKWKDVLLEYEQNNSLFQLRIEVTKGEWPEYIEIFFKKKRLADMFFKPYDLMRRWHKDLSGWNVH